MKVILASIVFFGLNTSLAFAADTLSLDCTLELNRNPTLTTHYHSNQWLFDKVVGNYRIFADTNSDGSLQQVLITDIAAGVTTYAAAPSSHKGRVALITNGKIAELSCESRAL